MSPPDTSSVEVLDWHLVPFLDLPLLQIRKQIEQFIPHQE